MCHEREDNFDSRNNLIQVSAFIFTQFDLLAVEYRKNP